MPRVLITLMLSTFTIGTAESVIAGILPPIARDTNVSLRAVGLLITVYALVVVVTGPIVTAMCNRFSRRSVLMACMTVFAIGNLVCALAPGYNGLIIGRAISALTHSTLIAVAVACARDLAPPHQRARASAQVTLGIGLATVLGVPAGTAVGDHFGWRATFTALTLLSLFSLLLLAVSRLPEPIPRQPAAQGDGTARSSRSVPPGALATAVVIICGTAGVFTLYTYAVPYLTQVAGLPTSLTTPILLLYGAGGIVGNILGAKMADRSHHHAALTALVTGTMCLLGLAAARHIPPAVPILLTLVGLAYFATIPALNAQIVAAAPRTDPAVALAVNNSAFCIGIALGSWLGGTLLAHQPLAVLPLASASLTALALAVQMAISWRSDNTSLRSRVSTEPDRLVSAGHARPGSG
ncbi:MFS transporter [Streptomyces sp. NPDC047046]|uniref:MFS transporter n=1 Tax=Streptomyces sp. NPDC047046 TaxID=3155378 RepID=UPI0033E84DD0